MKKLSRKLFLSIAALAVCAATLVSTTFAWYVNNPTSTVGAVEGSTATAGTTGSISVSQDGETWKKNLTEPGNIVSPETGIIPVTPTSIALTTFNGVDGNAAAGNIITFDIWVKADVAGTATVTTNVVNSTGPKTQIAFVSNGMKNAAGNDIAEGTTVSVDAVEALYMGVILSEGLTGTKIYEVKNLDDDYSTATVSGATALGLTSSAHTYYSAINPDDEIATSLASGVTLTSGKIAALDLAANTAVKMSFVVWLDGTDTMCFNACAGQTFAFDFQFDFVPTAVNQG